MTTDRVPHGGDPTAGTLAQRVPLTLLEHGRWNDAATFYPAIIDPATSVHARLLLAAGRITEAGVVLAAETGRADAQLTLLHNAHSVLTHGGLGLPQLIATAAALGVAADPLANLVVMRAAQAAGRPEMAAHYAAQVLSASPGDLEASSAVVVDLVGTGAYIEAVRVIDRADVWSCDDEARPLDRALEALESSGEGPKAAAMAVIGDYMHRESDPTVPVSAAEQASRHRWRMARRQRTRRVPVDWMASTAAVCVVGGVGFAVTHNALPAVVCSVVVGGWLRQRPVPGVDPASSQLVRAVRSPTTRLNNRRYHVVDVITFLLTYFAALSLASTLPFNTSLSVPLGLFGGVLVALAATRGRRRWVRRQRTRLLRPALDPTTCRCLDLDRLHSQTAQPYVDSHLFPVDTIAELPGWQLLQCLETYSYFLSCPAAGLTIALSGQQ